MAVADQKLFQELKLHYPEVPDDIVTSCITRLGNDRDKCMESLSNESAHYLFGLQNSQLSTPVPVTDLAAMTIGESRPRSDSSGSNMSNTSSSSASSRPPFTSSHSLINVPGYRGPIIAGDELHPATAPVVPNDISQFMDIYGPVRSSQNIPNIDCNNSSRLNDGHQAASAGAKFDRQSGNSPPNHSKTAHSGLRPIEVQHIQTNQDQNEAISGATQNMAYLRLEQGGSGGHATAGQSQPVNRGGWLHHPVSSNKPYSNPGYQNVSFPNNPNTTYPSDPRTLPVRPYNFVPSSGVYKSPSEEHPGVGSSQINQNHYGSQLSQTTIYLHNPTTNLQYNPSPARPNNYSTTPRTDRTMHSPVPSQYSVHSSVTGSPAHVRPVQTQGATSCQSPQGVSRPVYVEIKGAVQSQIQRFNNIAGTGNVGGPGVGQSAVGNTVIGPEGYVTNNQPSYVGRLHPSETRPTVINMQGPNTSQSEGGFLQFPPMPNVCRVPGHPHGSGTSVEHEPSQYGLDYRHTSQPFVSPASSHSSLSSESSAAVSRERPRSGSIDDPEYTQALLSHQKSRMNKLIEDLTAAESRVHQLKGEVTMIESKVIEKKRKRASEFPSSADLAKLKGDNLQLRADIQMMTREMDCFNNGETPLGVLDPLEQQSFYMNMNTGQQGSVYGNATTASSRVVSTVSTAVSTNTGPTRPPSLLPAETPPSIPPRDTRPKDDVPPPLPPRSVPQTAVPPAPPQQPYVSSGESDADGEQWSCSACTFLNHPALNKCECCEMPRMTGGSAASAGSPGDTPDTFPLTAAQSAQTT